MRTVESLVNGRFKVTGRPLVAPGKCAVCGTVEKPVVDFGLDIDFYGTVLFCLDCLSEAIQAFNIPASTEEAQPSAPSFDVGAVDEHLSAVMDSLTRLRAAIWSTDIGSITDSPVTPVDDGNATSTDEQPEPTLFDSQPDNEAKPPAFIL